MIVTEGHKGAAVTERRIEIVERKGAGEQREIPDLLSRESFIHLFPRLVKGDEEGLLGAIVRNNRRWSPQPFLLRYNLLLREDFFFCPL